MKFPLRDWITGFVLERCSRAFEPKPIVAYLYNGVRLPALPEWDRDAYPFAVISQFTELYYLTFYSEPVYHEWGGLGNYYKSNEVCSAIAYTCSPKYGDATWVQYDDGAAVNVPAGERIGNASTPLWANLGLASTNTSTGVTEYIEASNPIPVYE